MLRTIAEKDYTVRQLDLQGVFYKKIGAWILKKAKISSLGDVALVKLRAVSLVFTPFETETIQSTRNKCRPIQSACIRLVRLIREEKVGKRRCIR